MGRITTMNHIGVYDEGEDLFVVDNSFIVEIEKKYCIKYQWYFDECGAVGIRDRNVWGSIEDNIKALLETAKTYNRRISGTFSYQEESGGGSIHSLVFVAKDYTAMIDSFNTDVNVENLSQLNKSHTSTIVRL